MKLFYVNALDIMYIWMRQPQAVTAMRIIMSRLSPEERLQFVKSQDILKREKSISKMFLAGLVGRNFTRPLRLLSRLLPRLPEGAPAVRPGSRPPEGVTPRLMPDGSCP